MILACTDGSSFSPSLYQHAAWAALRLDTGIEVLHVLEPHRDIASGIDLTSTLGTNTSAQLIEEITRLEEARERVQQLKGKAILEDASHQLRRTGLTNIVTTQRPGTLVETLQELETSCELVVIGKRGAQANFAKEHLGANLERVVRTAVRPVLVTPQQFQPIDRFLIAFDGGPSVSKAVEFALHNPLLKGLGCHLLRAGHVDDKAKWYLGEAASKLRTAGYGVTTHAIEGAPEKSISEVIQRERIQLLVMGAYGHSPIRNLILGSTTTNMVRTSPVPVLMFR